ncbi:MAG: hypothetical protein H6708_21965 [Kofleriaceae bacterium]|nr:hypothetical protein [Kofleriaceae bacterium]
MLARAAAPVPAGPLVVADDVAYVWGRDGRVVALDPDGAPRDVARTRAGAIAVAVDGDDLVGAIDDVTRPLTRVDRGGGAPVDVTASVALPTDDRLTELAALRGVVYGALDDQLVAIAGDGAVTRVVDESARPRCVLAAAGQLVYVHAGLTATELVVLQPGGAPTAVRALRRGDAPVCAATADHAYVAADGVIVRVGPGPRATVVVHTGEVAALAADAAGVVWVERAARGWEVRRAGP